MDTKPIKSALIYAPRKGFLSRLAGLFFGRSLVLSPDAAVKLLPAVSDYHLSTARRLWQSSLNHRSIRRMISKCSRRLGVSTEVASMFVNQRMIRAYSDRFNASHSIMFFSGNSVMPLFPATFQVLCIFDRALGGASVNLIQYVRRNILFLCAHVIYISREVARIGSALLRAALVSFRSIFLWSSHNFSPGCKTAVFLGHKNSTGNDPAKLSETLFWNEVSEHIAQAGLHDAAILLLNAEDLPLRRVGNNVFVARDLFGLRCALSWRQFCGHWWRVFVILVRATTSFTVVGVADDLMSSLCGEILRAVNTAILITTNSSFGGDCIQEGAILAGIDRALLYYSSNNTPLVSASDPVPMENPALLFRRNDIHFSWDEGMSAWLRENISVPPENIVKSGPVMFASMKALSCRVTGEVDDSLINVGVFDVTPMSEVRSLEIGFGRGVYRSDQCLQFFSDILSACQSVFGEKFRIIVKFKRPVNALAHDLNYFPELEKILLPLGSRVTRLDPTLNPWLALRQCDVTIGMPFTSMIDAGSWMGKDACFYFPESALLRPSRFHTSMFNSTVDLGVWLKALDLDKIIEKRGLALSGPFASENIGRFLVGRFQ